MMPLFSEAPLNVVMNFGRRARRSALLERRTTPYGSKIDNVIAGLNDASYIDPGPTVRAEVRRVCLTNGIEQVDVYTAYYRWTGFEASLSDSH